MGFVPPTMAIPKYWGLTETPRSGTLGAPT
jgi:hypothetical protein